jgi:hypothetical protein
MDKLSNKNFLFNFLQFFNFLVFIVGTFLLSCSIYLWITINSTNSFILSLLFMSTFFILSSAYGYFCTWNSPGSIIIYEIFLFVMTVLVFVTGIFLHFDETTIVQYMILNTGVENNRLSIIWNIYYIKIGIFTSAILVVVIS